MGTLDLCPIWDIYSESLNLSEDYASRFFLLWSFNSKKCHTKCHIFDILSEENDGSLNIPAAGSDPDKYSV